MSAPYTILFLFLGIVILFILLRLFLPTKGEYGEKVVAKILSRLPEDKYRVFNDVILPTEKGFTQIDHIVVSAYGVFIIETKSHSGTIYGKENSQHWTQTIHGRKYQMYNPVLQNAGHVRAVKRALAILGDIPVIPILAFSNGAEFKVDVSSMKVVHWRQLTNLISGYVFERISSDVVRKVCHRIESVRLSSTDKKVRKQHVENVQNIQIMKAFDEDSGICPRCGRKLVLRYGQYGKFYGCSNYPICRYTHPIK